MSEPVYNPKERFKKHLKRKSSSRSLYNTAESIVSFESLSTNSEANTESCPVPSNPFKVSSPKKRRTHVTFSDDAENAQDSFGTSLQKLPEPLKTPTKSPRKGIRSSPRKKRQFERYQSFDPNLLQEFHAVDFSQLCGTSSAFSSQKPAEPVQESSAELPLDLRLGGKIRIVSKVTFPWMNTRKSTGIVAVRIPATDRYEGLKYFNKLYSSGQEDTTLQPPTSILSLLEASSLYYQFPVVPGMALYPRITSELKNVTRVPLAQPATTALFNQWVECYEQLFMSYKRGERDTFYVASAAFNVLFTKTSALDEEDVDALGIDDNSQSCFRSFSGQKLVAIVTHTNSATREHLRSQGVDYEMIGATKSNIKRSSSSILFSQNTSTLDCFMSDSKENSLMGTPEASEKSTMESPEKVRKSDVSSDENESPTKTNQQWLKEIGVSPRQINRGNVRRKLASQLNREGLSCILVKGSGVQSLYNALMSSDIVHEKTGPYTKVPPTLIAMSPFLYGQLLSLNKTSQIISKAGTKASEYVLEMDGGPILPHCTKMMTRFIRTAQLCRNDEEKTVSMQVTDRHTNQGMSDWTKRATNWNSVTIQEDCVKWTKT
uniref:NARG2_C domain-containing protein n=1 Tax=Caenorhabditis tropicalis TaxID=1561998 RepID=A0A1I7TGB7_9PELO